MTTIVADAKIICPVCKHMWVVPAGTLGVECNCHTWCHYGTKAQDCHMIPASQAPQRGREVGDNSNAEFQTGMAYNAGNVQLSFPLGAHQAQAQEGFDIRHATFYCTVHKVFSYRQPVFIEVDWSEWVKLKKKDLPAVECGSCLHGNRGE